MKKLIIFIVFTVLISGNTVHAGKIDDFFLNDLDNARKSFSSLKGEKLTVLDFWATWCKPCSRAIPKLVLLYEEFKDQGVQFIGISVDSPRNLTKVKPFANAKGITYPVLLDSNSEIMNRLQVTVMPTIMIVNEKDEVVLVHRGYRPGDEDILKEEIEKLLSDKTSENEDE